MATLSDLRNLRPDRADSFAATAWNPFSSDDVLSGAQILEVRHDILRSSLSITLELRVSEYDWQACAGLITAFDVTNYVYSQDLHNNGLVAWTILSSITERLKETLTLQLSGTPAFSLKFTAGQAAFYSAKIEGMEGLPPPDYTAADAIHVETKIPNWDAQIHDVKVAFFP